jgi:effector-binding domain-containing protein
MVTADRYTIFAKTTEPVRVAYTQFLDIMNATSRIWMLRDWAKQEGYHLIGAPRCVFNFNGGPPEATWCEVQWAIAEAVEPSEDEIGVRWVPPSQVVTTYHQGDTADLEQTAAALHAWGEANGYRLGHSACEIYWFDVRTPREHWITEIQMPIEEEARG